MKLENKDCFEDSNTIFVVNHDYRYLDLMFLSKHNGNWTKVATIDLESYDMYNNHILPLMFKVRYSHRVVGECDQEVSEE